MSFGDLWHGPDYAGQFDGMIREYDAHGDYGGDALRYAIFSTLNDGRNAPGYQDSLRLARERYGLTGFTGDPQWDGRTGDSSRIILSDFTDTVAQPLVGSWLSLTSWLFWFKVGFLGW